MDYDPESPEARAAMSQPVGVATICPSPTNPRKSFDPDKHTEMVDSVRKLGVLQPIVVRPWPADYPWTGDMPLYELVAGERRWRAAKDAGLKLIPATVRHLSNEEVLEIQVIENLHRDDLNAIEEARGFETTMKTCGYTADQLAKKIGKSRGYIYGRLKLCALGERATEAYCAGEIDKSVALLLARVPLPLQDDALEKVTAHNMNHRSAADFIRERYMLDLREAPFPFDTLETVHGHCQDCPKRTGNQPELYRDVRSADICTDPTCYGEKRTFNLVRMTADAQRAGRKVATPEDAKKIMPYGDTRHACGGYAPMDSQWYGQVVDGKYKTPRELITAPYGMGHPDVLLVPHPATGRLVEVIKESALRTAIKERMPAEQAAASTPNPDTSAHTERQKATKAEAAYRMALFEAIDGEILLKGVPLPEENRRLIARQFWARLGYDAQARLARHWLPDGIFDNDAQRAAAVDVEKMDSNALNRFIFLCALVGMLDVPHYTNNIETPSQLTDCARRFGLDPAAIKAGLDAPKKPKTSKKSAPKTASTPNQAALAIGEDGAAQADGAEQAARAGEAEALPAGEDEQAAGAARHEKPKKSGRASPAGGKGKTTPLNPKTQTNAATAA